MFKLFCLLLTGLFCLNFEAFAMEENNLAPDKPNQAKEKDPRTIEEKARAKLHLPPTRRIYYHNIDKSARPATEEEYCVMSLDKKRRDFVIPEPDFKREEDIILPEPDFRVVRYNLPPGQRNIDVRRVVSERAVASPGILSPDKTKMVYTKAFFYPQKMQTASCAYLIKVPENSGNVYDVLYKTNVMQGEVKPFLTAGMDELIEYQFKTLFPIDWSKDSNKIAFKEKTGSNLSETWQTNIIIYDFKTNKAKRLNAVREAIIYWWRENKNIDLKDYMWDIFPIGWDKNNPDRMILYAYAFTKDKPLFLGTWSIDYNENRSELISVSSAQADIDLNGFGLKEIRFEH